MVHIISLLPSLLLLGASMSAVATAPSRACLNAAGDENCVSYIAVAGCDAMARAVCAKVCGECVVDDCADSAGDANCGKYLAFYGCDVFSRQGCAKSCDNC